jgi:hypothetical protein
MNIENFKEALIAYEKKTGVRLHAKQRGLIDGILLLDNGSPCLSYRMFGDNGRFLPRSESNDAASDVMRLADRRFVEALIVAILVVSQPTAQMILHCSATGRFKRKWMKQFLEVLDSFEKDPAYTFQIQSCKEKEMIQIRNAKGVDCKVTAIALNDINNLRGLGERISLIMISDKKMESESTRLLLPLLATSIRAGAFVAMVYDE